MNSSLIECLLFEEESTTLDFKVEQYKFVGASEEEKAELLKDILGFANAWRRAKAYILIGVKEVRGGRSEVVGIPKDAHLTDHALQQFVNCVTNRPVHFAYEACLFEGKQIGIIQIEEQTRPIYLTKDYGNLRKNEVYVRRGSSTTPAKPASLDEIAQMGAAGHEALELPQIVVEYASVNSDLLLGPRMQWSNEFCRMPKTEEISQLRVSGGRAHSFSYSMSDKYPNESYYHELAWYEFCKRFFKSTCLALTNTGKVAAKNVRVELAVPKSDSICVCDESEIPELPERMCSRLSAMARNIGSIKPVISRVGTVKIDKNDDRSMLEIECGILQPGRKVVTDCFYLGIRHTGEHLLKGKVFAENLVEPMAFELALDALIDETNMSLDELRQLGKPETKTR